MPALALSKLFPIKHSGKITTPASTESENPTWHHIGEAHHHLLKEFANLYWIGVENELESVLFTLRAWKRPENGNVELEDERDGFLHGFDTFIDQVSEDSRHFAENVAASKKGDHTAAPSTYIEAL